MSIIDKTYFINNLSVDTGTYSNIDSSISKYEPEFLNELLGYEDAKEILEVTPSSQKLIDIRDGVEYTDSSGDLQKWKGLANTELISPIANYVYIYYVKNIVTSMQAVGLVTPKQENSGAANSGFLLQQAQVEMQGYICELNHMLCNEYPDSDFYCIDENINVFDL